jgi:hypothetical protein
MKKRKKKMVLWFLAGALIAGMGMTLSMGMAIGSFTSALFESDGKAGVSPPITLAHNNPTAVRGPGAALQTGSAAKGPGSVIRQLIPSVIVTKSAPQTHAKLPAENLWEDWSPEKALAHLSSWPGQAYPSSPAGALVDLDLEGWNPTYTSRYAQNRAANRDAGSNSWLAMGSTGASYSRGGSFSSGGGSLRTADGVSSGPTARTLISETPIPSSVLLLGSGILGLLGFMRRVSNKERGRK